MDLPIENGDFPWLCKRLPEGTFPQQKSQWTENRFCCAAAQIGFIEFVVAPLALAMAETPGVW
jgi:hypothetical protein